jgi:hypothetical protein
MLIAVNYHYIRESYNFEFPGIYGVTTLQFENQLKILSHIGKFVNPNEILNIQKEIESLDELYFLITFDDGLKEQFTNALPILNKMGISASFFINPSNLVESKVSPVHQLHILRSQIQPDILTEFLMDKINDLNLDINFTELDFINAKSNYFYDVDYIANFKYLINFKLPFKERDLITNSAFQYFLPQNNYYKEIYMNKSELVSLAKMGLLGSHTYNHLPVGTLSKDELLYEINNSYETILNITNGIIPNGISYPYGNFESCKYPTIEIADLCGFNWGLTMERAANINLNTPLGLARFDCNDLPGGNNPIFLDKEDILKNIKFSQWDLKH